MRFTSSLSNCYKAVKLSNRGLLQLSGKDCFSYLQTLVTNDLRSNSSAIYTSFLNIIGKVLMDFIVYKQSGDPRGRQLTLTAVNQQRFGIDGNEDDSLLLECDLNLLTPAYKTLFAHKIRKEVVIDIASDYQAWAIYPSLDDHRSMDLNQLPNVNSIVSKDILFVNDPRSKLIGYRFVTRLGGNSFNDVSSQLQDIMGYSLIEADLKDYRLYRYKLGIAEGLDDFRPCFYNACDANIDIMNGFSLIKGHFVGRPTFLKAKILERNVSRIMPIEFNLPEGESNSYLNKLNLSWSTVLTDPSKSVQIGTMINRKGKFGIALINYSKAAKYDLKLFHLQSQLTAQTWVPFWWPKSKLIPMTYRPSNHSQQFTAFN